MTGTDADYLVLPSDSSRITGHYYLTNRMLDYSKVTPTPNVTILTEFKTLNTAVSSSYEAKSGGIFDNAQNIIPLRHLLQNIFCNPQPKEVSPIITNNLTSFGIFTHFTKPLNSKTWDIQYHFLGDRIQIIQQIQLIWKGSKFN